MNCQTPIEEITDLGGHLSERACGVCDACQDHYEGDDGCCEICSEEWPCQSWIFDNA